MPTPPTSTVTSSLAKGRTVDAREPATPDSSGRAPGMVIAERYQLDHLLGEGGMGAVWAAKHVHTRKQVALKFIKGGRAATERARRRAFREARAATVIQHPNVVTVHDVLEVDGAPVLVMDLLDGESLGSYLERQGRLSLRETAFILSRVVSAIGSAHAAGVVHRDLKPENIFVARTGDRLDVKVLDFGLAKLTATEGDAAPSMGLTHSGDIMGTPHYMAPEQAFGERDVDARADVWAIGVILYECLAGQRPFTGENLGQVLKMWMNREGVPLSRAAPELPIDVHLMVNRLLTVERAERPADLGPLLELLNRYADSEAQAQPLPARRSWLWPVLAATVALATAVAGIWWSAASKPAPTPVVISAPPPPPEPVLAEPVAEPAPPPAPVAAAKVLQEPPRVSKSPVRKRTKATRVTDDDEKKVPLFGD
jgi:eukaryotic-like serine/threonine-protein kinase